HPPSAPVAIAAPPPPPLQPTANTTDSQSHLCFGTTHAQYPAPHLPAGHQPSQTIPYPTSLAHTRNSSSGTERDVTSQPYPSQAPQLHAVMDETNLDRPSLPPLRMDMQYADGGLPANPSSSAPRPSDEPVILPPLNI